MASAFAEAMADMGEGAVGSFGASDCGTEATGGDAAALSKSAITERSLGRPTDAAKTLRMAVAKADPLKPGAEGTVAVNAPIGYSTN